MPSDARWGDVKIIEPIDSSKNLGLVGGLRNAFERGESFEKAKQSFINAGYKSSEVEAAVPEMRKLISSMNQPIVTPVKTKSAPPSKISKTKQLPTTPKSSLIQKRRIPKALMITLIIILISILVGAAVLGFFWDKWF